MCAQGEALLFLLPSELKYAELLSSKGAHIGVQDLPALLDSLPPHGGASQSRRTPAAELHPATLAMLRRVEAVSSARLDIRKLAKDAFRAHVRAYAAHPASVKSIFHVKRLHLGHLAATFGLNQTPALLGKAPAKARTPPMRCVARARSFSLFRRVCLRACAPQERKKVERYHQSAAG